MPTLDWGTDCHDTPTWGLRAAEGIVIIRLCEVLAWCCKEKMEDIGATWLGYCCEPGAVTWRGVGHHVFPVAWHLIADILYRQGAVAAIMHAQKDLSLDYICCVQHSNFLSARITT